MAKEPIQKIAGEAGTIEVINGQVTFTPAVKAEENIHVPAPLTSKMQTRLEAEMEAGRKRVNLAAKYEAETAGARARILKDQKDREGSSTPVFRPGVSPLHTTEGDIKKTPVNPR